LAEKTCYKLAKTTKRELGQNPRTYVPQAKVICVLTVEMERMIAEMEESEGGLWMGWKAGRMDDGGWRAA